MQVARIAVLAVALGAGFLAWSVARNLGGGEGAPVVVDHGIATDEVLVAARDIEPGERIVPEDLEWERWPTANIATGFIRRGAQPDAVQTFDGAIARGPVFDGEPVRPSRLVQAGTHGYLSAALPSGMRAVSTRTSPQTGAGGFILPNDRVDVILTRRESTDRRGDNYVSEQVLSNVRVLAIDQTVEDMGGEQVVIGNVATLALTPEQTEILAMAEQLGDITLSLRSIADDGDGEAGSEIVSGIGTGGDRQRAVGVVRFGVPSRVSVN